MKKIFVILIGSIAWFIISCSNNSHPTTSTTNNNSEVRLQCLAKIKNLEAEIHKSLILNNVIAGIVVTSYDDFVKMFPDDSLSPDFLFKAGEITTATKQYPQSLMYYQSITSKYPKYKLVDVSLYMQGVLLDNYLNDDTKAKTIYEEVIAKYPTSSYATDAKSAISNLGKSDDELIKEFKKKNGQK